MNWHLLLLIHKCYYISLDEEDVDTLNAFDLLEKVCHGVYSIPLDTGTVCLWHLMVEMVTHILWVFFFFNRPLCFSDCHLMDTSSLNWKNGLEEYDTEQISFVRTVKNPAKLNIFFFILWSFQLKAHCTREPLCLTWMAWWNGVCFTHGFLL